MAAKKTDYLEIAQYKIDRTHRLGGGNFGVVYKGRDETTARDIAVKHVTNCSIKFAQKEVDGLCSIPQHSHIVQFIDSFVYSESLWIVLEFCNGLSLDDYLEQQNPSLSVKINIIRQLVDTVTFMHGLNPAVAHRDLKPSNVIIVSGVHIKICDFGLAKIIIGDGFNASTFAGSPSYIAHELFQFQRYDALKADVFSLGLVMLSLVVYEPGKKMNALFSPERGYSIGQEMHRLNSEQKPMNGLKKKLIAVCVSQPAISQLVNIIKDMVLFLPQERLDMIDVKSMISVISYDQVTSTTKAMGAVELADSKKDRSVGKRDMKTKAHLDLPSAEEFDTIDVREKAPVIAPRDNFNMTAVQENPKHDKSHKKGYQGDDNKALIPPPSPIISPYGRPIDQLFTECSVVFHKHKFGPDWHKWKDIRQLFNQRLKGHGTIRSVIYPLTSHELKVKTPDFQHGAVITFSSDKALQAIYESNLKKKIIPFPKQSLPKAKVHLKMSKKDKTAKKNIAEQINDSKCAVIIDDVADGLWIEIYDFQKESLDELVKGTAFAVAAVVPISPKVCYEEICDGAKADVDDGKDNKKIHKDMIKIKKDTLKYKPASPQRTSSKDDGKPVPSSKVSRPVADPEPMSFKSKQTDFVVHVLIYNITELHVDAIVNAANSHLDHGGGVAKAIADAAGPALKAECKAFIKQHRRLDVMGNTVTTAGRLPCKKVIHAVGPMMQQFKGKQDQCYEAVKATLENIIGRATQEGFKSIAIPAISSGVFGVPPRVVAQKMAEVVTSQANIQSPSLEEIYLVDIGETVISYIQNYMLDQSEFEPRPTFTGLPWFTTEESSAPASTSAPMADEGFSHFFKTPPRDLDKDENCIICMDELDDPVALNKCGHCFCRECIESAFHHKPVCPVCSKIYGLVEGNQPKGGTMKQKTENKSLPGYQNNNTIIISYSFWDGVQEEDHPNPGQPYHGTRREAYLPDNSEGRKVLALLKKAFKQRLVFTIGRSRTTGKDDTVTWNDIHHKTSRTGGPQRFGYPDPTYLARIQEELAAKGVVDLK